jgi:hypothetical protein
LQTKYFFSLSKVDYSTIERDYGLKGDTFRSDKGLIPPDQRNLSDVDINQKPKRGIDNQSRLNYEIADKIANQFSYENQPVQQNGAPQQAQQKQMNSRFDNQNGSFSTGLDGTKGQNVYSSGNNGAPPRPSLPGVGPIANRNESEQPQKTPTRNRIEFPKPGHQLPQVLPQLIRGPAGANRQYPERTQDDFEQTPPLLDRKSIFKRLA